MNEAWLWHKHDELIENSSSVQASEKRFMKRYDAYMLKQDVSGNAHLADTLVRFCRDNKAWLEAPKMFEEFLRNGAGLISQGSISELVLQGCIRTIQATSISNETTKRKQKTRPRRIIVSEMDSDSEEATVPNTAQEDVDMPDADEAHKRALREAQVDAASHEAERGTSYGICGCGEKIRDLSAAIICADLVGLSFFTD